MDEEITVETPYGPVLMDPDQAEFWRKRGWPGDETLRRWAANGTIVEPKPESVPELVPPVVLVQALQTSIACPAQWDAWDAEGKYYYLRYRSGHGTLHTFPGGPNFWERHGEHGELLAEFLYGHPLDGSIELAEFAELTGVQMAPSFQEQGFNAYLADELRKAAGDAYGNDAEL